jgi:hypothetical protein
MNQGCGGLQWLTNHARHHTANGLRELEHMSDSIRNDEFVGHFLLCYNDGTVAATNGNAGDIFSVDSLESVL